MRTFKSLRDFYTSREWTKFLTILADERTDDDGYLRCAHCGKPIIAKYDRIGHHSKIPLTEANVNNVEISLNPDNVIFVHHKCHNVIHERFGHECPKRVYLVYGPPCSGKSSWVYDSAGRDDLVVDMDNIWQMISINQRYDKPPRLKSNVFAVRDCLIDQIKTRYGKWKNAYIVGGYPLYMDRERLCASLGAEPIFIGESKETCLARASERPNEWKRFVEDWFESFTEDPPLSQKNF